MTGAIGVIDRVLAQVGERVVSHFKQRGTLAVQACSTVRTAPCPTCRCWSSRLHGSYFVSLTFLPFAKASASEVNVPDGIAAENARTQTIGTVAMVPTKSPVMP